MASERSARGVDGFRHHAKSCTPWPVSRPMKLNMASIGGFEDILLETWWAAYTNRGLGKELASEHGVGQLMLKLFSISGSISGVAQSHLSGFYRSGGNCR